MDRVLLGRTFAAQRTKLHRGRRRAGRLGRPDAAHLCPAHRRPRSARSSRRSSSRARSQSSSRSSAAATSSPCRAPSRWASSIPSPSRCRASSRSASRPLPWPANASAARSRSLLARPVSRRATYGTLFAGDGRLRRPRRPPRRSSGPSSRRRSSASSISSTSATLPLLWLNATLLYVAFGSIALAASVSFDRLAPALGIALGFTVVSYFLEVLGSLWEATPSRSSRCRSSTTSIRRRSSAARPEPSDLVVLGASQCWPACVWSLVVFPRRDLAAPS